MEPIYIGTKRRSHLLYLVFGAASRKAGCGKTLQKLLEAF